MANGKGKEIVRYHKQITRSKKMFPCRECRNCYLESPRMTPRQLIEHAETQHHRNKKLFCPWCYAEFRKPGVAVNIDHLLDCFDVYQKGFVLKNQPPIEESNPVPSDSDKPFKECSSDCFDFQSDAWVNGILEGTEYVDTVEGLYDPCGVLEAREHVCNLLERSADASLVQGVDRLVLENEFTFSEASGVGSEALFYLKRYFETRHRKNMGWYHCMVKAFAYPAFVKAMRAVGNCVALLPYWCVCNGTQHPERPPDHTHHRHMIVFTSSQRRFKKAWESIQMTAAQRLQKSENCRKLYPVQDEYHFVNLLAYVSHERSSCSAFNHEQDPCLRWEDRWDPSGLRVVGHYYIHRKTFEHSRWAMHLWLPKGVQKYFEAFLGHKYVYNWFEQLKKTKIESSYVYTVPIGKVYNVLNCQFPGGSPDVEESVEALLQEKKRSKRAFLFVSSRRVVHFKAMGSPEERSSCFEAFWKRVADTEFVLCPKQQRIARELVQYDKRIQERHERESEGCQFDFEMKMKSTQEEYQSAHERFRNKMQEEMDQLRGFNKQLLEERNQLLVQVDNLRNEWKRSNDKYVQKLEEDCNRMREECDRMREECNRMREEGNRMREEIAYLRKQLEESNQKILEVTIERDRLLQGTLLQELKRELEDTKKELEETKKKMRRDQKVLVVRNI